MKHALTALFLCILIPSSVRPAEDTPPDAARAETIDLPFRKEYSEYGIAESRRDFRFRTYRGQAITVSLTDTREKGSSFTLSLYEIPEPEGKPKYLFRETTNGSFSFEAPRDGEFVVRLQEEEILGGKAILTVSSKPVLLFPISDRKRTKLVSLFGDGRDEGVRFHEGIDIAAPRSTPVVAAAAGTVRKVGRTEKGGNVISLWDPERRLIYYYAHLETQEIAQGANVKAGDRLGTVGNSGNASGTFTHLHFTVYTENWMAIDPLRFVYDLDAPLP